MTEKEQVLAPSCAMQEELATENGNINGIDCWTSISFELSEKRSESYRIMALDAREALYEAACQLDDLSEAIDFFDIESLACLVDSVKILKDSTGRFLDAFINCKLVKKEAANG